jgi:hypothetical protein
MSTLRMLAAFITLVVPASALAAPAFGPDASGPRIRPSDGRVAAVMVDGLRRSPTLRAMVEQIEQGDVIVYLETRPSLRKDQLSGMLTWLTATPAFRYVRVSLNPELARNSAIAALGHELQHVLEVVSDPSIVSNASMESFYQRHGVSMRRQNNGWDSLRARDVGDEVRRDLNGGRSTHSALETARAVDPLMWTTVYRTARESGR